MIPSLTMGNIATMSMSDSDAVQRTMETLQKTISKLRDADMWTELKDCQKVKIMAYKQ